MSDLSSAAAQAASEGTSGRENRRTPNADLDRMSDQELAAHVEAALDRMSLEGLQSIADIIRDLQKSKQDEAKTALLEKWRREAAEMGMLFENIMPRQMMPSSGRGRGGRGGTVAPKYRSPDGSATWSGRGIPPKWMTALEAEGRNREEFRIKPGEEAETAE